MLSRCRSTSEGAALTYVAGYQNDIFISYAHVDDVELSGPGWVTTFVRFLKAMLSKKLGRPDACKIWSDHGLRRDETVTPQIMEEVRGSATLLIILSPGFLASAWCGKELKEFFGNVRDRGQSKSVFVVELDRTERSERPPDLADRAGFRFWYPDPDNDTSHTLGWPIPDLSRDHQYFSDLDDLVQQIADALRRLGKGYVAPAPPKQAGTVFLAEATDDLDAERDGVRRFLEQAGLRVVPDGLYALDASTFSRSAAADIAAADVFVQLLSAVPGKRPPDLPEGFAKRQMQLALDAKKPILQWRNFALDPAKVEDEAQRALLESPTVRAEGIEDFKEAIRRRVEALRQPPPPPPPRPARSTNSVFVFVDRDSPDRPLAEQVCDILRRNGAGFTLPIDTKDPGELRQDLEQNFTSCNALIVIYGSTTAAWVKKHLLDSRKAFARRHLPPRALAVFQGPPAPKGYLPVQLPSMAILDCQNGVNEAEVVRFLRSVEEQSP